LSNINSKELKFGLILIGQKKRRRHFTPFIATTDGMLGKEAKNFVAKLVDRLGGKWMSPYSQVMAHRNERKNKTYEI